jgi:hypothetical protein
LTLLRRATDAAQAARRRCLRALSVGRVPEATRYARQLYTLCPDERAAHLLAVCHMLQANWTAAVAVAQIDGHEHD